MTQTSVNLDITKPLLYVEKISHKIHLKKWFLYPLPLIIFYVITSVIPHVYVEFTKNQFLSPYYHNFVVTIGWLLLIIGVTYGTVFYKRVFIKSLKKLQDDQVICSKEECDKAIKELHNRKIFFTFLVIFEIMVGFFWYYNIVNGAVVNDFHSIQIPDLVIQIFVLPLAAETFTVAIAGSRLPIILKNIKINVLHFDQHGGLKPFGDIFLTIELVYLGAIILSVSVFHEFRSTPIVWIPFVIILALIILLPQISLRNKLVQEKNNALEQYQRKYEEYKNRLEDDNRKKTKDSDVEYTQKLLLTKMEKDQIELMNTFSFDLISLYKIMTLLIALASLPSIINFIMSHAY
ncbi:MAG: hypothetical protein ACREAD_04635 [Nitrosopumilaceae archaeon]